MVTTISLLNTSITSHRDVFWCVCKPVILYSLFQLIRVCPLMLQMWEWSLTSVCSSPPTHNQVTNYKSSPHIYFLNLSFFSILTHPWVRYSQQPNWLDCILVPSNSDFPVARVLPLKYSCVKYSCVLILLFTFSSGPLCLEDKACFLTLYPGPSYPIPTHFCSTTCHLFLPHSIACSFEHTSCCFSPPTFANARFPTTIWVLTTSLSSLALHLFISQSLLLIIQVSLLLGSHS